MMTSRTSPRSRHRTTLLSLALVPWLAVAAGEDAAADDRPNILFIMADDHATNAIGAYGGRLAGLDPTPAIDRLASEGAVLSNCFCTNSICTPSRATIMTGQYSHENGVKTLRDAIDLSQQHLARLMGEAGYETAVIGKWHLKVEPSAFDYYAVLPGQGSYFNPVFRVKGEGTWPRNTRRVAGYNSTHSTEAITELSLEWLEGRDGDRPFFLMHQFKAPHATFENAERYDWLFDDVEIPEPASLRERGRHGPLDRERYGTSVGRRTEQGNMGRRMFVPPDLPDDEYKGLSYQRYLKKYLRCVRGIDDGVARLLAYLEDSGELDETIIIYTSDQGFMLGEHDYIDKRWMYEESMRMPFIVRYPGAVPAGSEVDAIVTNVDFAPTLLDFAGAPIPEFMSGRSARRLIEGGPAPDGWPRASYYRYWMHLEGHLVPAHYGIRTDRYKLIYFYGLPLDARGAVDSPIQPYWELYDLLRDPLEMENVVADEDYAGTLRSLREQLVELQERVGDVPVDR